MRKRDRLTTAWLAFLYIGQVYLLARGAYYAWTGRLQFLFDGPFGWALALLLRVMFLWSLESIRRWNKRGFTLFMAGCAINLALQVYILIAAFPSIESELIGLPSTAVLILRLVTIGMRLVGPVVSPILLWLALQLGSPSAWQQMESRSLLRLFPSRLSPPAPEPRFTTGT